MSNLLEKYKITKNDTHSPIAKSIKRQQEHRDAKSSAISKKKEGHEHFYRNLSVGDKGRRCIHCSKSE